MNDVKQTLKPLEWSSTIKVIDKSSALPMVVKPTPATAEQYGISKDPILLHHFWVVQRIVAQNVEMEGTYVVGPQMEISSDYTGTFQYRHDQKGNSDVVQVFSGVKEIASCMPERVFAQERLVVYPASAQEVSPNGEKVKSLVLQPREQLTVYGKQDVVTSIPSRAPFGFGGKTRFKQVTVPCVTFFNETSKELINLPLSTKGRFCTLSYIPSQGREFDFKDILREIDTPINLITCRNCPQTLLDEHFLRPGMRLRFTAIEEHEVILGVTTQEKIVEFASEEVEFILPKHLDSEEVDREQEIAYQTALQRFLMECQIKNSAVNIKDYRKSIRNHVSRTVRLTHPKALSQTASYRDCKYTMPTPAQNGLPAIAFLSSSVQNPVLGHRRRSSLPSDGTSRPAMPLPGPPTESLEPPPPPPRNARLSASMRATPRPFSVIGGEFWNDAPPSRPPPPPPSDAAPTLAERPKSNSLGADSKGSVEDDIWETPDESCLQRLRSERRSARRQNRSNPYENSADLFSHSTGVAPTSLDITALHPTISLDDIERSPSPEFHAFTHQIIPPKVPSTSSTPPLPDKLDSPILQIATFQKSVDSITSQEDENDGLHVPTRTTSVQAEASAEYGNVGVGVLSSSQTSSLSTPENEQPSESHYENFSVSTERSVGSPERHGETAYEFGAEDNEFVKSGSQEMSKDGESVPSARSSPSVESTVESDSIVHSNSKSSSASSSRSSSKLKNGFHVSRYSVVSDDSHPSLQHLSFTCNYLPSPTDWSPPADLSGMTVDEVANSMRYIGMSEDTVEWFRAEKVDGQLLCVMEDDAVTEHFRLSPFQRKKLSMFLKGWRPKL